VRGNKKKKEKTHGVSFKWLVNALRICINEFLNFLIIVQQDFHFHFLNILIIHVFNIIKQSRLVCLCNQKLRAMYLFMGF